MNMSIESKKQALARRLIEREVLADASILISDLMTVVRNADYATVRDTSIDQDELSELCESRDYEAPVREFIEQADGYELRNIFEDILREDFDSTVDGIGYKEYLAAQALNNAAVQRRIDELKGGVDTFEPGCEALDDLVRQIGELECDLEEELDRYDWLDENQVELEELRVIAVNNVEADSAWQEVCEENNLDPEYDEVYEHWIVTPWLGRKLAERGYVVREVCNLTIYGRCGTGQALALDRNMQEIAMELWGSELEAASE